MWVEAAADRFGQTEGARDDGWKFVKPFGRHRFDLQLLYLSTHPGAFVEVVDPGGCASAIRWKNRPTYMEVRLSRPDEGREAVRKHAGRETSGVSVDGSGDLSRDGREPGHGHAEPVKDPLAAGVWVEGPVELANRMFRFDADMSGFDRLAAGSPLEPLHEAYRGFKPVGMPDPFQGMSWVIVGQQVNVTFAAKLKRALMEHFGDVLQAGGRIFRVFPSPERIAGLRPEDLRPFQFSRQKAEYLIELARRLVDGWDLTPYEHLDSEEAIAKLMELRGVGRWSAECFLLFVFRHPDVLPAADIGLRRALGRLLGLGRNATEMELRAFGESFRGWRSYVSQYLWLALREGRLGDGAGSGGP